jgi:hypothetical protein
MPDWLLIVIMMVAVAVISGTIYLVIEGMGTVVR